MGMSLAQITYAKATLMGGVSTGARLKGVVTSRDTVYWFCDNAGNFTGKGRYSVVEWNDANELLVIVENSKAHPAGFIARIAIPYGEIDEILYTTASVGT